jgi:hypothetical protein
MRAAYPDSAYDATRTDIHAARAAASKQPQPQGGTSGGASAAAPSGTHAPHVRGQPDGTRGSSLQNDLLVEQLVSTPPAARTACGARRSHARDASR